MTNNDADWVPDAIKAIPKELSIDEVASFLITVVVTRFSLRESLGLLMSLPLTLSRTVGMSYKAAAEMYGITAKEIAERAEH